MGFRPILRVAPILAVSDMEHSVAFYSQLGFAAVRYRGGSDYAFLTRHGFELHLLRKENASQCTADGAGVYFFLERGVAAEFEAEFRSAGVLIDSPLQEREWRMNEFVVLDPDGNRLRFGESSQTSDHAGAGLQNEVQGS